MPGYAFTATSWNGTAIVGGSIASAYWLVANGPLATQQMGVVAATVPGRGDVDVRGQPKSSVQRLRVNLSAVNQTDLAALHALFNEQAGLAYFRMTDGAGVVWRRAQRVIGIEPVHTLSFDVVFYVPNPVWEEDTVNTDSQLNKQTSPIAINVTNNGTRKARPVFVFTADAAKTGRLNDYAFQFRGFIVNRAPNALKYAYLADQSGAAARFATDSSGAGATVKNTTGATTTAADIAAGAATITLTSAASWPAAGMGIITDSRGAGFHDQFSYTSIAGAVLQGVVWMAAAANGGSSNPGGALQTAGGIAHTIAQVTAIQPSGAMLSGNDCRVWLDDAQVDRWLVNWNAATSDIVINCDLPAAKALTVASAMTASIPANGGTVTFNEDISWMADRGFFVIGDEVFHYASKSTDGHTVTDIQRGLWSSTAAVHAADAAAWANPKQFVVAMGYALAGTPPCPSGRRPAFQLPGSSNQTLKYGDQSDDASTIFFDRATPDRPMQFVPGFDADGNSVSPLLQVSASGNILTFKDDVPGDGSPPYNYAELFVPQGIKAADANAIKHDWTPSAEVLLQELWTRDAGGVLKLQDSLQQAAAAAARALPASLVATAYNVKLKSRYNVGTGHRGTGSEVELSNTASYGNGTVGQRFVLEKDFRLESVTLMLRRGAGNQDVTIRIVGDSGGAPPVSPSVADQYLFANITVSAAAAGLITKTLETPIVIPAGTYQLVLYRTSPQTNQVWWTYRASSRRYRANCSALQLAAGAWASFAASPNVADMYFLLNGAYMNDGSAPINSDQPVKAATTGARTGLTDSFDKAIYTIEPAQAAYVHRMGGPASTLLHLPGVLANGTTGDSITLDKWMKPTGTLAIDCDQQTVIYTEDGIEYPVTKCCAFSNPADWLPLQAGANALTYTDASLVAPGQLDLVTTFRGVKA